ncbi:hypothetical protein [Okeania sp. SIO1I7]|uniref:hypothetical protein n=1 Tax=Okeania sp. SIO1I7 TaxID=2607772 RepID=UPI0013FA9775|nr:hypothetical protein [Okeania sp. SIO1I7]NET25478.1 hypothetical protein [Okeania sp. SIO1I7]
MNGHRTHSIGRRFISHQITDYGVRLKGDLANASGEGIFGTGPKISQQEAIVLERLKMLLELD